MLLPAATPSSSRLPHMSAVQLSLDSYLLRRLAMAVEQDVGTFSVSDRQTTVSHSTLNSLYTLSGRALVFFLGNLLLEGLEKVNIRKTLSKIPSQIQVKRVSTHSSPHVLKLQRWTFTISIGAHDLIGYKGQDFMITGQDKKHGLSSSTSSLQKPCLITLSI